MTILSASLISAGVGIRPVIVAEGKKTTGGAQGPAG
jgi:hypothetical protein